MALVETINSLEVHIKKVLEVLKINCRLEVGPGVGGERIKPISVWIIARLLYESRLVKLAIHASVLKTPAPPKQKCHLFVLKHITIFVFASVYILQEIRF